MTTLLLGELFKWFQRQSVELSKIVAVFFKKITAFQNTMFSLPKCFAKERPPWSDSPQKLSSTTVLPLSLPGHNTAQIHWLWSFHASCLWSGFNLPNFAYTMTMVHSWESRRRIQGLHKVDSNSVWFWKLVKCMNEILSTLLPTHPATSPAFQ